MDRPPYRSWLATAPTRGPWWVLPVALMLCWQGLTSVPHLGYFYEQGIADEDSIVVQVSARLSSLDITVANLSHLPAFFAMAWAWCWALGRGRSARKAALLALAISAVFALVNELSQLAVPYRYASPLDLAMNLLGATLAIRVHGKLRPRRAQEEPLTAGGIPGQEP